MQIKSRRRKLIITALSGELLAALDNGELSAVCHGCGALDNSENHSRLDPFVGSFTEADHAEASLWHTLWVGVDRESGHIFGLIQLLGRPTEERELTLALFPFVPYDHMAFVYMFTRVAEWSLSHRAVYYLRIAPATEEREAFLRHFGFVQNHADGYFEREKNKSEWTLICASIGLGIGVSMGEVFGGTAIGIALGLLFGLVLGQLLDHRDISRRRTQAVPPPEQEKGE